MKKANNNEVDLLLRSLARGRNETSFPGSAPGDGGGTLADHLDADELNSYAEGVVPAPARARYTEHLADCETCRRLVIGLTQAAGAATRFEAPGQQARSGFWQKLTALFSPAVLRYAVPALVLTAVIGISLLALRQQRRPELMALNQPADSAASNGRFRTESPTSPSSSEAPSAIPRKSDATASDGSSNERSKNEKAGQGVGTMADENVARPPLGKDAVQPAESSEGAGLRPYYAPEPKAAAPPPPRASQSETDLIAPAKEQAAKREEQERQRDDVRNQPAGEQGPNRSAAPTSTGTQARAANETRRVDGLSGRAGAKSQDKKIEAGEVESRTVSGRRFTRAGNAWIDTAYDSSRPTINVARGSEQFRALAADEPGIRAIAEQLKGVVIIVWNNRAYRIQ